MSIVMPVCNEADFIDRSLSAVLDQDYPELEVLVMDGMSDDGTREIAMRMADSRPDRDVMILDNPQRIVPEGLNLALEQARGEVIVRVDGHCLIPANYVRRCVEVLHETGAACVGGVMHTVGQTTRARAIAIAQSSRFGVGGVAFRTGRRHAGPADTVPFGGYRRAVFERVGSFDPELVRNQDDEFNYRLNRAGEVVWLDPSIRSTYYSRATFRRLARQYFEYGLYKVRVIQKVGLTSVRHLIPASFVLSLGAAAAVSMATRQPLWLGVLLSGYLTANVVASVTSSRRDLGVLPFVPVAYASMHVAYGIGFLAGLWRWRAGTRRAPAERAEAADA